MISKTYTKYIQSLHFKKSRDRQNAFIAEGSKVVMDLLNSTKIVCKHILGREEWLKENEGKSFQFVNDIFGGSIPKEFIPAISKGFETKWLVGNSGVFQASRARFSFAGSGILHSLVTANRRNDKRIAKCL